MLTFKNKIITKLNFKLKQNVPRAPAEAQRPTERATAMIPGPRRRYLAEIAETVRGYRQETEAQAKKEMAVIGLSWVETADFLPQQHFLVFEKL